jgi:putative restriction endonuclease
MTPLDRLRLEKAAADCGFEMTAVAHQDALELRSARFPETVLVRAIGENSFEVTASDPSILELEAGSGRVAIQEYGKLYALLRTIAAYARTKPNRVADQFKSTTAALPRATEAERLVVQRVGQDLFRGALMDFWQGKCCVTGLDVPELLRASHIRPWANCETDEQRLDVFNGFLLAPQVDALFDRGFITFDANGRAAIASSLSQKQIELLSLTKSMSIERVSSQHERYLSYHRTHVWRG